MKLIIRHAKRRDIRAIQSIAKSSWQSTYQDIIPLNIQEEFLQVAYSRKMLKQRFGQTHFYVAVLRGRVVGFAEYSPINETGMTYLHAIYLGQAYQGQGIGTALLHLAVDELKAKEIQLTVESRNEPALQFYHLKGFNILETYHDDFYGHQLDIVRMHWIIEEKTN